MVEPPPPPVGALISFSSIQRTGAVSYALSQAAAVCLHESTSTRTSWGECGGGPKGCDQSSALPTHIYTSDPYPVPLRFFLICGPSMPPATRPQMHCLSLPPAPAPSSCLTMPGGFQEQVRGWHRRVDEVLQCTNCSLIAPGSDGTASTPGALTNSLLPHPSQRQGVRGEAPLCSV